MEWMQVLTIIATLLGGVYYIHMDVREIRKDTQQHGARIDKLYETFMEENKAQSKRLEEESRTQSSRTDKLYEMFIEVVKNKNTP